MRSDWMDREEESGESSIISIRRVGRRLSQLHQRPAIIDVAIRVGWNDFNKIIQKYTKADFNMRNE